MSLQACIVRDRRAKDRARVRYTNLDQRSAYCGREVEIIDELFIPTQASAICTVRVMDMPSITFTVHKHVLELVA